MNAGQIFINIVIYSGILQGIYSAMVLTHTRLKNPANYYLATLLLVLSLSIAHSTFLTPYFHISHGGSMSLKEPFIMLVVPLLWFYVKKLGEPSFNFAPKHLIHFVPFIVVMVFSAVFMMHRSDILNNPQFYTHTVITNIVIATIAFVQYLFYMVYIFNLIRKYRKQTLNELSIVVSTCSTI